MDTIMDIPINPTMDSNNNFKKMKTNFNKVMEFNRAFDMVPQEPSDYSCFIEDFSSISSNKTENSMELEYAIVESTKAKAEGKTN